MTLLECRTDITLCQRGDRQIPRRESDGTMVPLAVGFNGKKPNSPNDLVFDNQGALYFTDLMLN